MRPSAEYSGSVSMPLDCVRRFASPPAALIVYSCEPPSRVRVTASVRPSGDHAGALFEPRKLAIRRRVPVAMSCTYTTGLRDSKDTYASCLPLGDQAGEMIGSALASADCAFSPSASATQRLKRLPALVTYAMRVENTPFSPVSFS